MSAATHPSPTHETTTWRRLRNTPLRDLLRGRLTGRLDLEAKLAAPEHADLPPAARALVRDTVDRTRLWRSEKLEVAEELLAHFHDAFASASRQATALDDVGPDPQTSSHDAILTAFGDPRITARLIRRAKKRNRGWGHELWAWFRWGLTGIALIYLVIAIRFYLGTPEVKFNYVQRLNAAAHAVPPDQRAWPLYRNILFDLMNHIDPSMDTSEVFGPGNPVVQWQHEDPDDARRYLTHVQPRLERLRQAAQRPHLGYFVGPPTDDDSTVNFGDWEAFLQNYHGEPPSEVDADHPAALKRVAQSKAGMVEWLLNNNLVSVLLTDFMFAAEAGDAARAIADARAARRIAMHIAELPSPSKIWPVTSSMGNLYAVLQWALREHASAFSDEQWRELLELCYPAGLLDAADLEVAHILVEDAAQRMFTEEADGRGRLTRDGVAIFQELMAENANAERPDQLWWNGGPEDAESLLLLGRAALPLRFAGAISRREFTESLHDFVDQTEAQWSRALQDRPRDWAFQQAQDLTESIGASDPLIREVAARLSLYGPTTFEYLGNLRDGTQVGIALELYRRDHGEWPETLAALTPRYLDSLPRDRISHKPLRYRVIEGRPVVYSLGGDRDDDGGVVPEVERWQQNRSWAAGFWAFEPLFHESYREEYDGDLVIYPWRFE